MCGIVGYIGFKKASPILIDGLLKLEYRGYDSAGIATIEKNHIQLMKNKGRVKNLYTLEGIENLEGTIGIAHTRWATHGKPSKENSHPHMDQFQTFSVVHNGIVENYQELRVFLESKGYEFLSDTDTETIPNLISYYYLKNTTSDDPFLEAVQSACKDLKGSYAIEVLCKDEPNKMIVARKDSPLVIGKGNQENYICSDIPAILSYTKDFYLLNDGDIAVLTKDNVSFYDINLNPVNKDVKIIDWDIHSCEKDGYDDYMLKEIYEQPKSIRETIGSRLRINENISFDDIGITKQQLQNIHQIYLVACGTAMHAGLAIKPMIEKLCTIPVTVDIASEFRYRDPLIDDHTLCIYISQSGETADTIAALKLAKQKGAATIAISNVIGSSITREAHYTIYTHAGPEIAVASTKAYTSQITLLSLLCLYFAEILERCDQIQINQMKEELLALPEKIQDILKDTNKIKNFAHKVYTEKDLFFLGRGSDYAVAMEASLKLKEISYIHSEAYAAGELKHGPIALIENGVTVVGILTNPSLVEKSISNLQEVITRGAKTLIITNQQIENRNYDEMVLIPNTHPLISPILSIIPLQLFSYYISKEKGLDVDKPRNLAKSVTVE